ncbi:MAG: rhodanese-like domain-containing protein [bacterium]|nr:rhodanese-like domain-containing protein [bacterium]
MTRRDVGVAEAHAVLTNDPAAVYLDVRTAGEFEAGHPVGARNVSVLVRDPASGRPMLNPDFAAIVGRHFAKATTLVVACQSGVRSLHAYELLAAAGFTRLVHLRPGFGGAQGPDGRLEPGWGDSGLPIETGSGGRLD